MAYSLATSYFGESLLSGFNWFDGADLSNGYVSYKNRNDAADLGLFEVDPQTGVVRLGVDSTNVYTAGQGRPSIRLESKQAYNHGLFVADFLHMPPSQCGLWPAFWSYGPNWPHGGEIDIIEGANTAHKNLISAHTGPGCEVSKATSKFATGFTQTTNCDVGQDNIGCGFTPPPSDTSSYGDGFNAANGGVYAMQWDDTHIRVWHFPRSSIPRDIQSKTPDPTTWGMPTASFGGDSCSVGNYFRDMSIVLNINFCGDYGNAVWGSDGCTAFAPTCAEWVGGNPAAFTNAYWDVNYIDAYVMNGSNSTIFESADPADPTDTAAPVTTIPVIPIGNSSVLADTTGALEPTTTTTMTSHTSTTTKTVRPVASTRLSALPMPSNMPTNPEKVNDYAYLGCFGSSNGFTSFNKKGDDEMMTLKMCIEMCKGIKYAGVFDNICYCANSLDANTRASGSQTDCDVKCPGDKAQFCGGRVEGQLPDGLGASANITKPTSKPSFNMTNIAADQTMVSGPASTATSSGSSLGGSNMTTFRGKNATVLDARRAIPWRGMRRHSIRAAASPSAGKKFLLTVYAAVANEKPPQPAPAMARPPKHRNKQLAVSEVVSDVFLATPTSGTTVVTTIAYKTVHPHMPSKVVDASLTTTITVPASDCGCDETKVPMTTTVVECSSCGDKGENSVTLTVPSTSSEAPAPATTEEAVASSQPPASEDATDTATMNTPPPPPPPPATSATSLPTQPPVVAGARSLKVSAFMAILAIVLFI